MIVEMISNIMQFEKCCSLVGFAYNRESHERDQTKTKCSRSRIIVTLFCPQNGGVCYLNSIHTEDHASVFVVYLAHRES